MMDTVRSTLGQLTRKRGSRSHGRGSRGGAGLASQASGFIDGLLSGGDRRRRGRGRRRR
jgi:hypothetical protein